MTESKKARSNTKFFAKIVSSQMTLFGGGSDPHSFTLTSNEVGKIVSAVQATLVGWDQQVPRDWLADGEEAFAIASKRSDSPTISREPEPPKIILWDATSQGIVSKALWQNEDLVSFTEESFCFDNSGSLVRTSSRNGNTDDRAEVLMRSPGQGEKVTPDEVLAAIAALLKACHRFRYSMGKASKLSADNAAKVERAGKRFIKLIDDHREEGLEGLGGPWVSAVTEQFIEKVQATRKAIEKQKVTRVPEARIQLMGPLQVCFRLLYGGEPTSAYSGGQADTPFIHFASAFMLAIGWPCAPNTVHDALVDWRARYGASAQAQWETARFS